MNNKLIVFSVVAVLILGLIVLGFQVRKLQAEVTQLSGQPSASLDFTQRQRTPRTAQPDDWYAVVSDRWDPYSELARIQSRMNRLFNSSFNNGAWTSRLSAPAESVYGARSDMQEEKDKYVVSMDMPGMEKDNIDVEVKDNILFISGERKNANEEKNASEYRQEQSYGYFSQRMPLPSNADESGISVTYEKGVLTIEIPKLATTPASEDSVKKIAVK